MADRSKCFTEAKALAKSLMGDVKDTDIDHFINKFLDTAEKMKEIADNKAANGENYKKVVKDAFGDYLKSHKIETTRFLIEKKMDKMKSDAILSKIDALGGSAKEAREVLESSLVGGTSSKTGEGNSVSQKALVLKTKYINIIEQLKHKELYDVFASGEKDLNVAKEIFELSTKEGKPGISKDAGALEIAKVVHRFNQEMLLDKQDAGILVRNMPGYIGKQVHDKVRISATDMLEWSKKILPMLDEKTFKPGSSLESKLKFLEGVYEDITKGQKTKAIESGESPFLVLSGRKQATAHGMSSERVLHFKDAEAWHTYNKDFGSNTIFESVYKSMTDDTRKMAMVDKFGTDPLTTFTTIRNKITSGLGDDVSAAKKALAKNEDPSLKASLEEKVVAAEKEQKRFLNSKNFLEVRFREAEGATSVGADNLINSTVNAVNAWNSAKLLGKAVFSLATDPGHLAFNVATSTGEGFLPSFAKGILEFDKLWKGSEREFGLKVLEIHPESTAISIHNDIHGDAVKPGMMAKGMEMFFKSTGLSQLSETGRLAVAKTLATVLTDNRHLSFGELNMQTANTFARYEITEDVWNIIKQGVVNVETKGGNFEMISPSGIRNLETPQGVDSRLFRKQKEDAASKFSMFLNNYADMTSLTSTARTRALMLQGTASGTPLNAALKMVSQLKTPSVQMYNMLRQGIMNNSSVPHESAFRAMGDMNNVKVLSQFIPMMMGLGYLSVTAKALLKGETPPDPRKPEVAMDVFLRSGAGGIYSDFILGEYDRTYRNVATDIIGPTGQTVNEIGKIWAKGIRGEKFGRDAFNFALKSIPGNNHWVLRPLLDMAILNNIQEDMSPGTTNRRNRRLEQERGSHLIGR